MDQLIRDLTWEQSPRFVALYVLYKLNEEGGSFPWEWNRDEFTALTRDFKSPRNERTYPNTLLLEHVNQQLALTRRKLDVERMTLIQHQSCFNSQRLRCECIALILRLLESLIQPLEGEIERGGQEATLSLNSHHRRMQKHRNNTEDEDSQH